MASFLTAWLQSSLEVLERELAGKAELRPSARLPQPDTAMTLALVPGGAHSGRFLVTVDRYALQFLLAAARITDGSVDAERDRDLWRGILEQAAAAALRKLDVSAKEQVVITVSDAEWSPGMPSAAYELVFGETLALIAFTDEVQAAAPAQAEPPSAATLKEPPQQQDVAPSAALGKNSEPASGPEFPSRPESGRLDLLLDVELEASLRFGSREMALSAVLDLGAGDVVELDRHVSDPVDLLVGDKIVARGEVVLVNGAFGLRVLEVAEPKKRLESIRCLF